MSHIEYPEISAGNSSANLDKILEFYFRTPLPPGRLYRSLRHLTRDEKKLQRKLMNRANAQSSCDRKKAEMEELEEILRIIKTETTKLRLENERLKARIHQLEQKTVKDQDCCSKKGQSTSTIQIKQKLLPHLSTEPPNLLEKVEPSRITIQNAEHNEQKQLRTINTAVEPCFVCINNNRWVGDQNRYSIINIPFCTNHVCKPSKFENTNESVLQQNNSRYNNGEEDQYPVIGSVFQITGHI